MMQINFEDIKCKLRLYGLDDWSEVKEEIENAYNKSERIKTWFKLAFRRVGDEFTVWGFDVTEGLCRECFADSKKTTKNTQEEQNVKTPEDIDKLTVESYKEIPYPWDNSVGEMITCIRNNGVLGQQAAWHIGIAGNRFRAKTNGREYAVKILAATILHEITHVSQKDSFQYGNKLMEFISKCEDAKKLYIPTDFKIGDKQSDTEKTMIVLQAKPGFEHEVLPYLIEAEALMVLMDKGLQGENCSGVDYDPEAAYVAALNFCGIKTMDTQL